MTPRRQNKKDLTLDDLALMINRGFEETAKKAEVDRRFDKIEHRFERFEKVILADYERRLKRLEADIDYLKGALAM